MRGEERAELRRVYRDHVQAVFGFFSYSVARETAEDLTSSTFERVVRSWSAYDPRRATERAWVLAIARNLLTDHYRRSAFRKALSTDADPELLNAAGLTDGDLDRVLEADEIRSWLEPLSEREREVVALRYGADLAASQVAAILEISEANVHQIGSRSLRRLRESLE